MNQVEVSFREFGNGTFLVAEGRSTCDEQLSDAIRRSGSVSRAEEDCNRLFIVADIVDTYCPDLQHSEQDLIPIARAYAQKLASALAATFPQRSYEIEIVGEHLVDEEPLELCVTFRTVQGGA